MSNGTWTDEENDLIVADYFAMLADDISGRRYSKAEHRRALLPRLNDRSEGSVEFKHQNISAVLKGLGEDWIPGYKPAFNFQMTLVDAVARWLALNPAWLGRQPGLQPAGCLREAAQIWVGPPPTLSNQPPPQELEQMLHIARKFDVAGRDERNRALGRAGVCRCLWRDPRSSSSQPSMIPVNPSSFGRFTGAVRRYPGGTENANILRTLSREMLKCRAASRWLMPSAQARRTFRYMSTVMILPPSLQLQRGQRWTTIAPPAAGLPRRYRGSFSPPFSLVSTALEWMNGDTSGVPAEKRKLLGFTDNRLDAALQAGHFNDYLFVSLLRGAILRAVIDAGSDGIAEDEFGLRVVKALGFTASNKDARIHWMLDPEAVAGSRPSSWCNFRMA